MRVIRITNPHGLHLRSCLRVVKAMAAFQSRVTIKNGHEPAAADSIIELISLGAGQGTELVLSAEGGDAEKAIIALADLLANDFD